jgi:hypothetical protein
LLIVFLAFTSIACPPAPSPDPPASKDKKTETPPPEVPKELKTRIEAALQQVDDRALLSSHGFWTVFHAILGNGIEKTMITDIDTMKYANAVDAISSAGCGWSASSRFISRRVNAVDYICNGGKIRGMQFLPTNDGLDVQTGPQFVGQGHQDQFVAEMSEWGMPLTRKFKVGGRDYTFEDFTRQSKMKASVKREQELSWAIIVIGQYYGTSNLRWVNTFGEELTYDDIVRYETNASINQAACGGTHRLYGYTWAYHLHLKNGGKTDGVWKDVAAKIATYKNMAHELQQPDGAFSTEYFKGKGSNPELGQRISTTGHTVEWLALAMTDDELREPWMQSAVSALAVMILDARNSEVEGGALYHAAHGLRTYHMRLYGTPPPYLPLLPKK